MSLSLRSLLLAGLGLSLLVSSCGRSADAAAAPLGLKGQVMTAAPDNPLTEAKVTLGKALFFDPRLSGSGKTSCSTLPPARQGLDRRRAVLKKDDGSLNTRNTPTLYNVGYLDKLYWDGRSPTLEKTVRAAWESRCPASPTRWRPSWPAVVGYEPLSRRRSRENPPPTTSPWPWRRSCARCRAATRRSTRWQAGENNAVGNDVKEAFNDIF